jgi:dUTP pyrophosphatase
MERTVAVIKPGAVRRNKIGSILAQIGNLFAIADMKMVHLTRLQAEVFYEEHRGKDFFEAVIEHAISGPCVALLLKANGAIQKWRDLMGPADRTKQGPAHYRYWYGLAQGVDNALHGSDSPQAVEIEAAILGLGQAPSAPFVPVPWGEPGGGSFEEKLLPSDHPNAEGFVAQVTQKNPHDQIRFCRVHPDAVLPSMAHEGDSGYDISVVEGGFSKPGKVLKLDTGWRISPPRGFEVQVRTRSGMGAKGLVVSNSPGTIDSGYVGRLYILLANIGDREVDIKPGDRVAQLVPRRLDPVTIAEVSEMETTTSRGEKGYGSSGR